MASLTLTAFLIGLSWELNFSFEPEKTPRYQRKTDIGGVYIQKKAIPQYTIGYHEKMKSLEEVERNYPGLYITGAFRGGVSVEDCIANGKATAVKISENFSKLNSAPLREVTNV